jgi:hypothetical protein
VYGVDQSRVRLLESKARGQKRARALFLFSKTPNTTRSPRLQAYQGGALVDGCILEVRGHIIFHVGYYQVFHGRREGRGAGFFREKKKKKG